MFLDKDKIDEVFEKNQHQAEALVALYKLILPKWDEIKTAKGFPMIGKTGWLYICQKFIDMDKKFHKNAFPAGLWINKGFGQSDYLQDWQVSLDHFYPSYI